MPMHEDTANAGFTIVLDTPEKRLAMQLMTIKHALNLYDRTNGRVIITRGATPKRLLELAGNALGTRYPNTKGGRAKCIADINTTLGVDHDA